MVTWFEVRTRADADAIRDLVEQVYDGWYSEGPIDWDDFIDRLDGRSLPDGRCVDMGESMNSIAVQRIRAIVRELREQSS